MTIRNPILAISLCLVAMAVSTAAQGADNRPIFGPPIEKDGPTGLRETLYKLQVEESKKEYDAMLKRGEEAVKLAADLDRLLEKNGHLTPAEFAKVTEVEKLVKKIRSELGGSDDDGEDPGADGTETPATTKDAVKRLRSAADSLYQDLKKTNRFTISATAIETANAILKVARFLRLAN